MRGSALEREILMRGAPPPTIIRRMRTARALWLVTSLCLFAGCAPFQPEVALRPPPYREDSTFVLAPDVPIMPQLDRGTFAQPTSPQYRTDPTELALTPSIVQQCLAAEAGAAPRRFRFVPAAELAPDAFRLQLAIVTAHPGFSRPERMAGASATVRAPGAAAGASAGVVTAGTVSPGQAEALLEVRAPNGLLIDRVRLYAQRYPQFGEPLEERAGALCAMLFDELERYLAWRIGG